MSRYHEDAEQVEALKKWWQENGTAIIVGIVLSLAVIFGWRAWQRHQLTSYSEASDLYDSYIASVNENKPDENILNQIKTDYPKSAYAAYVSLMQAKQYADKENWSQAEAEFRWVLEHNKDSAIQNITKIRLARIYLQEKKYNEAKQLIENIPEKAFQGQFWELLGDIALAEGDLKKAKAAYETAKGTYNENANVPKMLELKLSDLAHINSSQEDNK